MPADLTFGEPIKFLGATVESFSASLGFNTTPSTLDVILVVDTDDGDVFDEGGVAGEANNPGRYASFSVPNTVFIFDGLIKSRKRTGSINGNKFNVTLVDARIFFKNIPVITNLDTFGTAQQNNIIDVLGFYGGSIVEADWLKDGVRWGKLLPAITNFVAIFYGTTYRFSFDVNFISGVHFNFRPNVQNPTLDELLGVVSKASGMDYYVTSAFNGPPDNRDVTITIKGISRRRQNILDLEDEIEHFAGVTENIDKVISFDIGRELQLDPNNVVMWGDNVHTIYTSNFAPITEKPIPIYNQFNDGNVIDKVWISFENIESDDLTLIENLPSINLEKKTLEQFVPPGGLDQSPPPEYTYKRRVHSHRGYIASEYILRAALFSKEAWITAVWYSYKDNNKRSLLSFRVVDNYDIDDPLGVHVIDEDLIIDGFTGISDGVPELLGIHAPAFDRLHPIDNIYALQEAQQPTDIVVDALVEAVYQVTLTAADNFYGKQFINKLPDSSILTAAGDSYAHFEKRFDLEYSVTDSAWINDPIPFPLLHSDSDIFETEDNRLKPLIRYDLDNTTDNHVGSIKGLNAFTANTNPPLFAGLAPPLIDDDNIQTDICLDEQDLAHIIKVDRNNQFTSNALIQPTKDFFLYSADVDVKQYFHNARFSIITLNHPLNIGPGLVRIIDNNEPRIDEETELPNPKYHNWVDFSINLRTALSIQDKTIPQEFFSWLYDNFTIHPDDAGIFDLPDSLPRINDNLRAIAASLYDVLMNMGEDDEISDRVGFAPRRYTGQLIDGVIPFDYWIPLKFNYERYGPFSRFDTATGGVKIIIDDTLSPWNFGNIDRMNIAGDNMAVQAQSENVIMSTAKVEVADFPIRNLGDGLGINSHVTNISLRVGAKGVTTNYDFKTFVGPVSIQTKDDFDLLTKSRSNTSAGDKEVIKIESLIDQAEKKSNIFGTINRDVLDRIKHDPKTGFSNTRGSGKNDWKVNVVDRGNLSKKFRRRPDKYLDTYYSSFDSLLHPYTTNINVTDAPHFDKGFIRELIHPFLGRTPDATPFGNFAPTDIDNQYDPNDLRSIGFRFPMVGVGWGYDILGRPAPSEADDGSVDNAKLNATLPYGDQKFLTGTPTGGAVPQSGYMAGPVELLWNPIIETWTTDNTFLAIIQGSTTSPDNQNMFQYAWRQTRPSHADQGIVNVDTEQPFYGSGTTSLNFASNLSELTLDPAFVIGDPVPSGTAVLMKTNHFTDSSDGIHRIGYMFQRNIPDTMFMGRIISSTEVSADFNRWDYEWEQVVLTNGTDFVPSGLSSPGGGGEELTAINLVEWENPVGFNVLVNPGVDMGGVDYPDGFDIQPISPNTIIFMRNVVNGIEDQRQAVFSLANAHDGTCD